MHQTASKCKQFQTCAYCQYKTRPFRKCRVPQGAVNLAAAALMAVFSCAVGESSTLEPPWAAVKLFILNFYKAVIGWKQMTQKIFVLSVVGGAFLILAHWVKFWLSPSQWQNFSPVLLGLKKIILGPRKPFFEEHFSGAIVSCRILLSLDIIFLPVHTIQRYLCY